LEIFMSSKPDFQLGNGHWILILDTEYWILGMSNASSFFFVLVWVYQAPGVIRC